MKCCVCEEKEFAVILETHLPGEDLPNLICDLCLESIANDCKNPADRVFLTSVIVDKEIKHGKRCQ